VVLVLIQVHNCRKINYPLLHFLASLLILLCSFGLIPQCLNLSMGHIKRFCCGIPGAKNLRQAQENAGAIGWQMSAEEHKRVDEAVRF